MIEVDDCPVKIAVRERPVLNRSEDDSCISYHPSSKNVLIVYERPFSFDHILPPDVSQKDLFEELFQPLVTKALQGFNCTALAYGQTGTGKTYTMGLQCENFNNEDIGVVPRVLNEIFAQQENASDASSREVSASFIEIYNEKVYDLLADNPLEQIHTKGYKFSGGVKKPIQNLDDGYSVLSSGNKNRHVRPTKMNPNSSRSHAIFTLYIKITKNSETISSCFNLVDLAGSEGVRRTGHQGAALIEGVRINQGLLSIGKVLQALATGDKVIPYRDSVLSSVLQDSLNLNSYLILLACVSPYKEDLSETLSTLRFAQNAKLLKHDPQINLLRSVKKKQMQTPNKNALTSHNAQKGITPNKGSFLRGSISSSKKPIFRSNTFCTPTKFTQVKKRRFNQSDFGFTNLEKIKNENKFKIQRSPSEFKISSKGKNNLNNSRSSVLSFNTSTSTAVDVPIASTYSPIVRKCLGEFEGKMKKMFEEFLQTNASMIVQKQDCNKESTPKANNRIRVEKRKRINKRPNLKSLSWSTVKDELRTVVRNEISLFTEQNPFPQREFTEDRATKNDPARCKLFSDISPITTFKKPMMPKKFISDESQLEPENETIDYFNQDGNNTIVNKAMAVRRSARLSQVTPAIRRSSRVSQALTSTTINPTVSEIIPVTRRSVRLSEKAKHKEDTLQTNITISNGDISRQKQINKRKNKRGAVPTNNAVIAEYFNVTGINESCSKNFKDARLKHEMAVLDLINNGSMRELQILPQVGLKTAYQIVTHRTLHGKFKNFKQFSKIPLKKNFWQRFKDANNISDL